MSRLQDGVVMLFSIKKLLLKNEPYSALNDCTNHKLRENNNRLTIFDFSTKIKVLRPLLMLNSIIRSKWHNTYHLPANSDRRASCCSPTFGAETQNRIMRRLLKHLTRRIKRNVYRRFVASRIILKIEVSSCQHESCY